ncbi:MAG: exodeoxyribonuclease VII large subunit [Bacteroidales bacterium]|nr:exodeoxyribonuclease VII large subunit [Bacteroidales bacterium]
MNRPSTLSELLERAEECVSDEFQENEWVSGQIADLKVRYNNHCYFELVETDGHGAVKAKARAIIWAGTLKHLGPFFEKSTGSPLQSGMKVLVSCQVQFSRLYGLSLIIYDIDPSYTLGEAEAERRKTIGRLTEDGLMEKNKSVPLPRLPRSFAIVSSDGAAGYRDFMKHLHENEFGYSFRTVLFEASVQGKDAPASMMDALDRISAAVSHGDGFDAVMIMRGGGSSVDLACFDDYGLCARIASFPLPVFTGVGHDKDYHVCDMVAAVSVKTPTALADYVLDIYESEDAYIESIAGRLARSFRNKAAVMERRLDSFWGDMRSAVKLRISDCEHFLEKCQLRLDTNPFAVLGKGRALVEGDEGRLESVAEVNIGDAVRVILKDGTLICKVTDKA